MIKVELTYCEIFIHHHRSFHTSVDIEPSWETLAGDRTVERILAQNETHDYQSSILGFWRVCTKS